MIMRMRLRVVGILMGVLVLPLEADADGMRSEEYGGRIYVGGGVPTIVKTNLATRRVVRMDRPQDMIDPWSPTQAPLPSFATQVPPTTMKDDTDPWGKPVYSAHVRLALDTTDPWSGK